MQGREVEGRTEVGKGEGENLGSSVSPKGLIGILTLHLYGCHFKPMCEDRLNHSQYPASL